MNKDDLEKWLETEEGAAWLEEKKAPLVNKKNELLEANKALRADLASVNDSANGASELLQQERDAIKKLVLEDQLSKLSEEYGVFPQLRDALKTRLQEEQDLQIKADGLSRKATVKADGKEIPVTEWFESWAQTDEAKKSWIAPPVNKGANVKGTSEAPTTGPEADYLKQLTQSMKQ